MGLPPTFLFLWSSPTGQFAASRSGGNLLEDILSPSIEALGFEVIRIVLSTGGRRTLQIMAERPDGTMSVEDCAELSRVVSAILDVEDPIGGEYDLEVSSPGIDRPLRPQDFVRFVGHEAKIKAQVPIDGQSKFRGEIVKADLNGTVLDIDGEQLRIGFDQIETAKLVLTEKLLQVSGKPNTGSAKRS